MRLCVTVLAVLMLTSMAVMANPGEASRAIRVELVPTSEAYEEMSGFVILNQPSRQPWYNAVIQVSGFEPEAWVAWGVGTGLRVGEFQCNEDGIGKDTMKLDEIGDVINVKWIDEAGGDGPIVLRGEIN